MRGGGYSCSRRFSPPEEGEGSLLPPSFSSSYPVPPRQAGQPAEGTLAAARHPSPTALRERGGSSLPAWRLFFFLFFPHLSSPSRSGGGAAPWPAFSAFCAPVPPGVGGGGGGGRTTGRPKGCNGRLPPPSPQPSPPQGRELGVNGSSGLAARAFGGRQFPRGCLVGVWKGDDDMNLKISHAGRIN